MEGKGKRGRRDGGKGIRFFPGTSFSPLPALIWEYLSWFLPVCANCRWTPRLCLDYLIFGPGPVRPVCCFACSDLWKGHGSLLALSHFQFWYENQGDHSFSTMIFHDFSMTKKMNFHDLSAQHISLKYTIHDLWMHTRIKYFQLLFVTITLPWEISQ